MIRILWPMGAILAIWDRFRCDARSTAGGRGADGGAAAGCEAAFWRTPLGRRSLEIENPLLEQLVASLHGESVLWVGAYPDSAKCLENCMIRNPMLLAPQGGTEAAEPPGPAAFHAALEELPFQSRALDGIVLHHALEGVSDARVALREAARTLAPGGRLIVVGYNPFSLLGLRRGYARVVPDVLSARRLTNPLRLFDWLTLLGLELDRTPLYAGLGLLLDRRSERPVPPRDVDDPSVLRNLPFGGIMALSATKKVGNYRIKWAQPVPPPRLAPVAYPRVASWQREEAREDAS